MTDPVPSDRGLVLRMRNEAARISSQHHQLDEHCVLVREALTRGALSDARQAFFRFADALDAHLSLEDEFYYPALHGLAPTLRGELAVLADEHLALRTELASVRDCLDRTGTEASASALSGFVAALTDHERREEGLLARAQALTQTNVS